jgi:O-antigen/teichoic acid export membrane protein
MEARHMRRAAARQALIRDGGARLVLSNFGARIGALLAVGTATLLVARTAGPVWVGALALLRVLPPLAGFLGTGGLPLAAPYFLAGSHSGERNLRPTLLALTAAGSLLGAVGWVAITPLIAHPLLPELGLGMVAFTGVLVLSQMAVSSFKSFCQGDNDLPGSNLIIVLEEATFLPVFAALWVAGFRDGGLIVLSLLASRLMTAVIGGIRLWRRGFFRGGGHIDLALARQVWLFAIRGQVGNVMLLVNLRFDFVIVDVLAGPAALGIYAVASKYAELLRQPSDAVLWVAYPRFARGGGAAPGAGARATMRRAGLAVAAGAIPLAALSLVVIPLLFGAAFAPAILPACILLIGLAGEGVAAVAIAYLYGNGMPGMASTGVGVGVAVTVVLDLILIPKMGIVGAAVASTAAYLSTTLACVGFFVRHSRPAALSARRIGSQGGSV